MNVVPGRVTGDAPAPTWRRTVRVLSWALLTATIAVQIAFPYVPSVTPALTTASVVLLTASVLCDAAVSRGWRGPVTLLVICGGGGLLVESLGVHTGFPFGSYHYTDVLRPAVLGVPLVVPLAWAMMAWPALIVARRIAGARWARVGVAAYALAVWDVFLDPQMVDAGNWRWHNTSPALPGVDGIPLTNFVGWLVVALAMMVLLDRLLPVEPVAPDSDAVPSAVYLWTYVSSVIADLTFFGRPMVALVGGVLMGIIAIPLALSVIREIRDAQR